MKTTSKFTLLMLVAAAVVAVSCKGKPDSGQSSASSSATVEPSKKASGIIDSLNITNADEKKVCALYDEAISEYIKQINAVVADTGRLKAFQDSAFDKKFAEESKKLKPEMDNLTNRLRTDPVELMKFEKFSVYESQRLIPARAAFEKIMMSKYKMPQ